MGASKRVAEITLQALSAENQKNTKLAMVRFGNVLGYGVIEQTTKIHSPEQSKFVLILLLGITFKAKIIFFEFPNIYPVAR